jgi:hypothetical protein
MGEASPSFPPLQQTHYGDFRNSFDYYFLARLFA